jgi:hypothetical protein
LQKTIKQLKPKLIILLGTIAVQSVIGGRWKRDLGGIAKWRGWVIPDQDYKCFIAPIFAPSYVKHMERPEIELTFKKDLQNALRNINAPFPKNKKPEIIDISGDLKVLKQIKPLSMVAFDYETTGLKPHDKGHEILCTSVAVSPDKVYVFNTPKNKKKLKPFIDVLRDENIKKMAQNMKYENTWTNVIFGTHIKNWYWDSMIAAHILDNRPGITGLKFQTYVQFGVVDYASEVTPHLMAENSKNANSLNRLKAFMEKPKNNEMVKKYCALDSIYQYRLALKQIKEFELLELPF